MFDGIMKQIEESKKQIETQLSSESIEVSDQENKIKLTMDGNGIVKDLSIDESLLSSENKEMLEDLLIALTNQAQSQAKEKQIEASKSSMGNLIPGGMDLGNLFG